MIPSREGWPTKAKEAPSSHEVRLTPLDTNPVFQCLGKFCLILWRWNCPDIVDQLSKRNLSFQATKRAFSKMRLDKLQEQSNKLTKNNGGASHLLNRDESCLWKMGGVIDPKTAMLISELERETEKGIHVALKHEDTSVFKKWYQNIMISKWCHDTKMTSWYQNDVMITEWCHDTKMTSWYQNDVMIPEWCHDTKMTSWYQNDIKKLFDLLPYDSLKLDSFTKIKNTSVTYPL